MARRKTPPKRVRLAGRLVELGIASKERRRAITKTLLLLRDKGVKLAELGSAIQALPSHPFSADFLARETPSAAKRVYTTGRLFDKTDTYSLLEELAKHLNYVPQSTRSATVELFPYLGRRDRGDVRKALDVFLEHHSLAAARELAGTLYSQVLRKAPVSPKKTRELLSFEIHQQANVAFRRLASEAANVRAAIGSFERGYAPEGLFSLAYHFGKRVETHPDYTPAAKRELVRSASTLVVLSRLDRKHVANPPEEYGNASFWWQTLVKKRFTPEKTRKLLAAVHNALPHLSKLDHA